MLYKFIIFSVFRVSQSKKFAWTKISISSCKTKRFHLHVTEPYNFRLIQDTQLQICYTIYFITICQIPKDKPTFKRPLGQCPRGLKNLFIRSEHIRKIASSRLSLNNRLSVVCSFIWLSPYRFISKHPSESKLSQNVFHKSARL